MNKKLIIAVMLSALTLTTACGKTGSDSSSDDASKNTSASITENTSDDATEDTTASGKKKPVSESTKGTSEGSENIYYDEDHGDESGEEAMRIEKIKRSVKADNDGFKIKDGILYEYDGVRSEVHIPEDVKKIESRAFWSNDTIEVVYIPSSVEEIGSGAFWSCSGLSFVNAEEGLKIIGSGAFWSCDSLSDVNLPESVEKISTSAFWAIEGITIHAPADSYAEYFANELGLGYSEENAEYNKSDRANLIRAAQYEYGEFTDFTIPQNITGIAAKAFQYCKNLKSITIPEKVEYIGARAFEYCDSLAVVRVEEGCQEIGDSAFAYCEALSDVYLPESTSNISKRAFEYCADDLTLHVPKGSYAEEYAMAMNIPFDNNMG